MSLPPDGTKFASLLDARHVRRSSVAAKALAKHGRTVVRTIYWLTVLVIAADLAVIGLVVMTAGRFLGWWP